MVEEINLLKEYGWAGLLVYVVAKYGHLGWKKYVKGSYVSWPHLDKRITVLEDTISSHMKLEAQEDILIAQLKLEQEHIKKSMETENVHIRESINDLKGDTKNIYEILGQIKNMLISQGKSSR